MRMNPGGKNRKLELLKWGLVPFWAKEPSIGNRMINARSETVTEKPAYRVSFRKKRCLVLGDGFYEWQATGGPKQPFFFHRGDGHPIAMAGLWDRWDKGDDPPLETFTILTTSANEVVAPVHKRMPVILEESVFDSWLDPEHEDTESLSRLLLPAPAELLETFPVSTYVNNPANEGPQCVEPIA